MARATKYVTIEGQFASSVLGTFKIIRGFATLQDLAAISAPFQMGPPATATAEVQGYQRTISTDHANAIKRYLELGRLRFIPEVILSIRAEFRPELDAQQRTVGIISDGTDGLRIRRRWRSPRIATHSIVVERSYVAEIVETKRLIRRIDGNHRLHLAKDLQPDPSVPTKYLAPFCAILLGPPGDSSDDFNESMLFHTINSTALLLDSEHALRLVLGQSQQFRTLDEEFADSAPLHLTRLIKTRMDGMPSPLRSDLAKHPRPF